jgi:tetratricopeptide (TPR) repeat protein
MMLNRSARVVLALTLSVSCSGLLRPSLSLAQGGAQDALAGKSLFDQGMALAGEKKFREALEKFQASQRFDPKVGTLMNIAQCHVELGQMASAWNSYRDAEALARRLNDVRLKMAEDAAKSTYERVSYLSIEVPDESRHPGLVIKLDGSDRDKALWGTPTAIDAGKHTLSVSAPDRVASETTIEIAPSKASDAGSKSQEARTTRFVVKPLAPRAAEKVETRPPPPAAPAPAVRLLVPSPSASLVVKLDGRIIDHASFSADHPVQPGSHLIEASERCMQTSSGRIDVPAGGGAVSFTVAPLQPLSPVPAGCGDAGADKPPSAGPWRTVGFVAGGLGVVGVVVGTVLTVSGQGKLQDAVNLTQTPGQYQQARSDYESARSGYNAGIGTLVVGSVLLAGGVALVVFAPSGNAEKGASLRLSPTLGHQSSGLTLHGTF